MKARFGAKVAPNSYELPRPPRTEGGEIMETWIGWMGFMMAIGGAAYYTKYEMTDFRYWFWTVWQLVGAYLFLSWITP